ncbi:short-chain dehydrogenase [Paenibacillus marchantiophytorum]|uniref:Short-chain dehydrogenase n=1 Tax=Paenibacillus marchantiophytorum TaxID=1619310 RepID=A0ABQ2BSC3_9BACL|nr:SDR family oxidoreductase [Paenibacillus marchantiophytorum]GGI45027.1 short-chain dehydrogenase [Paenibacillus marchantiophytorum]
MTLKDKRVIIIGGSTGIGLATAKAAIEQGASVVIAGRSLEKLEKAKAEINSDALQVIQVDNKNEEALKAFFEKVGHFDHLFTPGAAYVLGPISADSDIAESSFNGKFWPQYYAAKHAVPYISQSGSIVLMSGAAGQRPIPGAASYAACNGAIESLGKALAIELAPVRVNVVAPGTIRTEKERTEAYEAYKGMCLLKRVGDVEDVAHSVVYLMTNRYTTGSTLFPDGGYVLS